MGLHLVSPTLEPLRDVANVVRVAHPTRGNAEVVAVDTARVVLPKGWVDGLSGPGIAPVLEVLLVVLGAAGHHVRGVGLVQVGFKIWISEHDLFG